MTAEEFLELENGTTVRALGVTYQVGSFWGGTRTLRTTKQSPNYDIEVAPGDPLVAKMHVWPKGQC